MRPILRPGCHVLRRDEHEIQVGLDPGQAVVLADTAEVRRCLQRLHTPSDPDAGNDAETVALLGSGGLLVDSDRLLPLIPHARPEEAGARSGVAALARAAGDDAARLLAERRRLRIGVAGFGHACGATLPGDLRALLTRAGLRARPADPAAEVDLAVLVGVGEPPRSDLDGWLRDGIPHLVVRLTEGSATVGPFVRPGDTACLRCVDAHHTDADRAWPLLVEQYSRLSGDDRSDGVPEPADVLTGSVAVAWAARDLASYAEGRAPSTWSSTLRFDAHLTAVESRSWLRHPACGCGWA